MAFNDFRKTRDEMGPGAPSSGGGGTGVGALTAFIDQGSEFSGKLSFKDTVRIDGRFEGEISSENTLIVGESGVVHADILSETVIISGEVQGDIIARVQVTLHKTSTVVGNLRTPRLLIEDGAAFNGHIDMNPQTGANKTAGGNKPQKSDHQSSQNHQGNKNAPQASA